MSADNNRRTRAGLVIAGILGLGALFLWINLDLPIVRNAETYAQSAYSLLDAGLDPRSVVADTMLSCGKPIGFPLLSAPWVAWFGVNSGLMFASFLGTAFFVGMSCLLMSRLNEVFGIPRESLPLQMILLWFNPLLIYQFWSAYPDTLLAALAVAVVLLVDDAVNGRRERGWTSIVTALVLVAAVLVKYYGAILICTLPLAYACSSGSAHSRTYLRRWFAVALLPVVAFLAAAALGLNPLIKPSGNGGGIDDYLASLESIWILLRSTKDSLIGFVFLLGLAFNVLIVFLVPSLDLRAFFRDRRRLFFVVTASGMILGLLPFAGTWYNIRYFAPILPFLAVLLAHRLLAQRKIVRHALLATFVVIQAVLILNFNVRGVYERWPGLNRAMPGQGESLRMGEHLQRRAVLNLLDHDLAPGTVVFLWSDYYEGCVNPTRERLLRELTLDPGHEIDIRAVPTFTADPVERQYYVWVDKVKHGPRLQDPSVAELSRVLPGIVTAMGNGLFQVDPPTPGAGEAAFTNSGPGVGVLRSASAN